MISTAQSLTLPKPSNLIRQILTRYTSGEETLSWREMTSMEQSLTLARPLPLIQKVVFTTCIVETPNSEKVTTTALWQTINKAIELLPTFGGFYLARGWLETLQERSDVAMADFNKGIELQPKYATTYDKRGLLKQFQGDLDGALSDFLQYDALSSYRFLHDYAHLRIWVLRVRKGETAQANQELSDYLAKRSDGKPEDWPARIGDFLLGQMAESDFLAAATSSDENRNRFQHCQAWYYCGLKQLLGRNKKLAADDFAKCLATGQTVSEEYWRVSDAG